MKRLLGIFALCILATVPAFAEAHQGNADYRSEINSIRPANLAEGLTVEVVNFDDHVRLVNDTGQEVVILGYDDEPMARISAEGVVEVNLNSPSYYLNEDRFANVDPPDRADEKAAPDWDRVGDNAVYEWHDHRSHYMGQGTPAQVEDEAKRTKVFDYAIPLEVGGKPATIEGTLIWVGKSSKVPVIPFAILGLAIIAAIGFWITRRRRSEAEEEADHTGSGGPRDGSDDREDREAW